MSGWYPIVRRGGGVRIAAILSRFPPYCRFQAYAKTITRTARTGIPNELRGEFGRHLDHVHGRK
jgi:hypothetical protein